MWAKADDGAAHLEPWASDAHPSDVPRRHSEDVGAGRHEYTVLQGGTMDGTNCRSPLSVGMNREGAMEQTWESNRLVRMENVGTGDVVNPWLSNGRNNFRTPQEIVDNAVEPGMTDREKAMAIWFQECRYRYHGGTEGGEDADPVRIYNIYAAYMCGTNTSHFAQMLSMAGLRVNGSGSTVGHTTSRVFFDGGWRYLDANQHTMFLLRDNRTVADAPEITRDHDLAKRAHSSGILLGDHSALRESFAACFAHEVEVERAFGLYRRATNMDMTLRPGEALVWRWGRREPFRYRYLREPLYPYMFCNGLWEYRPDLTGDLWRRGAALADNVAAGPNGLSAGPGGDGTIVWEMKAPYVFVGGRLEAEGNGARFALSFDGETWQDVEGADLNAFFPPQGGAPRYGYRLRCTLSGDARLRSLAVVNDLQMSPLALPGMAVGANAFVYTDQTPGERAVRITHEWVERSASSPPGASPAPIAPAEGGETDGTDVVFRWQDAPDPDGDRVVDYHFELSDRLDVRWPLSTNFYRLISRTRDRGRAQFTLPAPGLLTPGETYYWRVRAKDEHGVWGPWSETWSFTARGPAYPLDVQLGYDAEGRRGVLTWKPNPVGRPPVRYRVYGSDEKGFSVSDEPYPVHLGESKELTSPFPANFIAETEATELAVLGEGVDLPAANKAYYRVVAVDANGKRSGPSDYASAPRPVLYTAPVTTARVGREYTCDLAATRSLGDLCYRVEGRLAKSYWDIEHPVYALERGPAWLTIDPATGRLSGTPDAPGRADVVVTVTIDRQVRTVDPGVLVWGNERVIERGTERVGTDTRRFTIEIGE
ncbi:MAG: hypothetical protein GXY85_01385 [Candidatus Brocadiaceae bacterium]|nr:hypothetical protein [Candidatus Brocadiaceae bacterium]